MSPHIPALWRQIVCCLLMGLVGPFILFTFVIFFGEGSYQEWNDRFHYELTNRYLFSQLPSHGLLGPLWRDDVLAGSPWATNKGPAPIALQMVAARMFHLSPVWIELVGNLTLYHVAVWSMFSYLRRELSVGLESATVAAAMFASAAYWLSFWLGNPDLPMAVAWMPALVVMAHGIERATDQGAGSRTVLAIVGLAVTFAVCAMHSTLASLPATMVLLVAYTGYVFGLSRSLWYVGAALGAGLLLYMPFLWSIVEATSVSSRYSGAGFFNAEEDPFNPMQWLVRVRALGSQILVGHNQFGIFLAAVLGALAWLSFGRLACQEPPRIRRILRFFVGASVLIPLMTIFSVTIDYLKLHLPLVGAWHVARFEHFWSFPLLGLAGWLYDRSLFSSGGKGQDPQQMRAFQRAIIALGALGGAQVAYSAYRMRLVPASIYPQNLVLYAYEGLSAVVLCTLLILLYRTAKRTYGPGGFFQTDGGRLGCAALLVLSTMLVTSVPAYRAAVLPPAVGVAGHADPIMTYAQRYAVPSDIATLRERNTVGARVVDLTRPWYADTLGPASETTLLPLGGLRTPGGYNFAPPVWYDRFLQAGINGKPSPLRYIVQVQNTDTTNFEALGLLDIQYILARPGVELPGYQSKELLASGDKMLYVSREENQVGPAFVSSGIRCFASSEAALAYIHGAGLRELRASAVLVSQDAESSPLCAMGAGLRGGEGPMSLPRVSRGPDRVRIETSSNTDSILTLADVYYPGWQVFVNGMERPLLRTYTTFRGVQIQPGPQVVEFVYAPPIFSALLRVSAGVFSLLLLAAAGAWVVDRAFGHNVVARV